MQKFKHKNTNIWIWKYTLIIESWWIQAGWQQRDDLEWWIQQTKGGKLHERKFLYSQFLTISSSFQTLFSPLSVDEFCSSIYRRGFKLEEKFWVFNFENFLIHFHVQENEWSLQNVYSSCLLSFFSFPSRCIWVIWLFLSHGEKKHYSYFFFFY